MLCLRNSCFNHSMNSRITKKLYETYMRNEPKKVGQHLAIFRKGIEIVLEITDHVSCVKQKSNHTEMPNFTHDSSALECKDLNRME